MKLIQIHTRKFLPPKDNIFSLIDDYISDVKDGDVILFASKVISIHQGRCIEKNKVQSKKELIKLESERYLQRKIHSFITITHNALGINAGIDPYDDYYIFLPFQPQSIAKELHLYIKKKFKLKELGVIITDSHSIPLRRGVMCYAVGFYGLNPLIDHGESQSFAGWTVNIVDSIAAFGGIYLGEAENQQTPITIVRGLHFIEFSEKKYEGLFFVKDDDLYEKMFKFFYSKS